MEKKICARFNPNYTFDGKPYVAVEVLDDEDGWTMSSATRIEDGKISVDFIRQIMREIDYDYKWINTKGMVY